SPTRMQQERLATLSYEGVIQVVAEIDGYEDVPTQTEMKKALLGRVLVPGDPLREAIVGTPAPAQRNPVGYVDTTEEESITPEERGRETGGRPPSTFLVNSNPHRWVWDPVEYQQDVQHTQAGRIVRGRWSVGHRRSGIEP